MKPKDSKQEPTKFIKKSGAKLAALTPAQGIQLMFAFYQKVRAKGCPFDIDGDMLLYQWGVYDDFDRGQSLHLDITRQFIQPGRDGDDAMSQLSLTFFFRSATKYRTLKDGNTWCSSPEELESFAALSSALQRIGRLQNWRRQMLRFSIVGFDWPNQTTGVIGMRTPIPFFIGC